MAKRINVKVNGYKVATLEQADATLARLAELKRYITIETATHEERVAQLTLEVSEKLSDAKKELEGLEQALGTYAFENRETLFMDDRKSCVLSFGTFGISANPPSLDTIGSTTQAQVIQLLKEKGLLGYVRNKEELDKDLLLGCKTDFLKSVRLRIKQGETFHYKVKDSGLEAAKGA